MPLTGGSASSTGVVRALLVRGMLAGLAAGLAAFLFAYLFGEPGVNAGIAFEEQGMHGHGGEELVSRGVQSTVGLLVGVLVYAVAIGGILALVHAATRGRIGPARPRPATLVLAAVGFVVVVLVPFLKYPGNPPGSSDDGSIGQRTGLYLVMLLFSVLVAVLATALGRALAARLGTWNATLVAGAGALVVLGVVMALLPPLGELSANVAESGSRLTETPQPLTDPSGKIVFPGFDPDLLYWFRVYSVGAQLLLWGVLAVGFAPLADRVLRTTSQRDLASAP